MRRVVWGNPFSHSEDTRACLHKSESGGLSCEWCGGVNRYGGLFIYLGCSKRFCCRYCYRSFMGL